MLLEPRLDAFRVNYVAAGKALARSCGHVRLANNARDVVGLRELFGCNCGEPSVDGRVDGPIA